MSSDARHLFVSTDLALATLRIGLRLTLRLPAAADGGDRPRAEPAPSIGAGGLPAAAQQARMLRAALWRQSRDEIERLALRNGGPVPAGHDDGRGWLSGARYASEPGS
jgi:hypothetical protein